MEWMHMEWMHMEWMHMDVIDVARILAAPPQSLHGGATSACISRGFSHCDYSCICQSLFLVCFPHILTQVGRLCILPKKFFLKKLV
jgi:hypothetical protein